MPEALPTELETAIARIVEPARSLSEPGHDLTGELASLIAWWLTVSDGSPLRASRLAATGAGDTAASSLVAGLADAERAIDAGATLIVPRVMPRDPQNARTVIALITRAEASAVSYQPEGMPDRDWMLACAAVRDLLVDVADLRAEPLQLLDRLGALGIARAVGQLIGSAARRTPCLVDGTDELAAALVADRLSVRARAWWRLGATSPNPGRQVASRRIDVEPGLPLNLSDETGMGAEATLALLELLTDPARGEKALKPDA